jgi:DNA excision repair protein ERCC-4
VLIVSYLLTYDAVSFNQLLETVLITNSPAPGSTRLNASPWLFLDAAHVVFSTAKERVYVREGSKDEEMLAPGEVPKGIKIVLEDLPKWGTLKEVLDEIENEIHLAPQNGILEVVWLMVDDGTNAVVVMCTDERTCRQLRESLQSSGEAVMRRKLQDYFAWKANFQKTKTQLFEKKPESAAEDGTPRHPTNKDSGEDPRLKLKRKGVPPNKRRRTRGGATSITRNAASGVIEIPDDDPADITQMYLSSISNIERMNSIPLKSKNSTSHRSPSKITQMTISNYMITMMSLW